MEAAMPKKNAELSTLFRFAKRRTPCRRWLYLLHCFGDSKLNSVGNFGLFGFVVRPSLNGAWNITREEMA